MVRWSNLAVPLGAGGIAAWLVSIAFWDTSKQGLLVGLSVIAAGVLVRLARGLPFTNADQYELDEIRGLTAAMSQIARSLRVLVKAVLSGMIGLVVAKPLLAFVQSVDAFSRYEAWFERSMSFFLGFAITYVLWRMLQVVKGDQDLTELQSRFVVRSVERRQAKLFDQQRIDGATAFKAPEGYGRQIQ